ncbi:MAG TPA: aminotransferase class V-fold PLP-dependent enzyme [Thermoanaerobaculia bacterium]|nr:aminotransferase class V-fold PLP-dependent enzyme [Thermoanaerobaculia bacterium]
MQRATAKPSVPAAAGIATESASTDALAESLAEILPALERFSRYEGPDGAVRRTAWRAALDGPLPEEGEGREAVLSVLRDVVIPNGLRIGAPGFTGWVTTSPTTVPAVAQLAGSITAAQRWWATPGNFLEVLALRWVGRLLGLPDSFEGSFTSGGATANLLGLAAARQHAGERLGVDAGFEGLAALPSPKVYASSEVHHVVHRACGVLGLGRKALRLVPVDAARRPDLAALERLLDEDVRAGATPVAVIASAGDVNTGVVDPVDVMRGIAHARGVWLHVDGAYGGFGVLDPRVAPLYGDLSKIDSFAVDPHKWMAAPVGCGAGFVRDGGLLARALALEPAAYVEMAPTDTGDTDSPFDQMGEGNPNFSLDHSAPPRGLAVWALLREIGARGMRERVVRHHDCARRVAERVRAHPSLELLAEPVLSICCFRVKPKGVSDETALDALNEKILLAVRKRGRSIPSHTRVDGRFALRPCFINPRQGLPEADLVVDEVLAAAKELGFG